jgi:rod shape-determining protein MreC
MAFIGVQHHRKWRMRRVVLIGVIAAAAVCGGVLLGTVRGSVSQAIMVLQTPFVALNQRLASVWGTMASIQEMRRENVLLQNQNLKLLSDAALLFELSAENELLRESLTLGPRKTMNLLVAHVTGRSPSGFEQVIHIDHGADDGIDVGMPVVAAERILVGVVSSVEANSSRVRLLTDPQSKVAAVTADTKAQGLLKGSFGNILVLDEIVKDKVVLLDELVLSSGGDGRYPVSFVLGRVREVVFGNQAVFKQAIVEPVVDVGKLTQVLVVLSQEDE